MSETLELSSASPEAPPTFALPALPDPHGVVSLVNRLWQEFNEAGDPFRLLEVLLEHDDKGRPTLVAHSYYTGVPFCTEVRTFQDEEHLARYLQACLTHQEWAERKTRVGPLFCKRTELPKQEATCDEVRDVLRVSKLSEADNGEVQRTLARTAVARKPDVVELRAKNEHIVEEMVTTLALLALKKPKKRLQDLHEGLLAAAEKEAAALRAKASSTAKPSARRR